MALNWQKIPTPAQIHQDLDRVVIGQVLAKMILGIAANNHFHRVNNNERADKDVEIGKSNILVIGPTGSGKTLLAETLATMFNAPFTIADATKYTSAGYVGDDVENIVRALLDRCDWNKERAESGIVYIDEIDKITQKDTTGKDVNGAAVQQALLKILEGTTLRFQIPQRYLQQPSGGNAAADGTSATPPAANNQPQIMEINTRNILFLCGGAFSGLEEIIRRRKHEGNNIGFGAQLREKDSLDDLFASVTEEDLVKFGFLPEFIGRLQTHAVLRTLTVDELVRVLKEPKNPLLYQFQALLRGDVELMYTEDGLRAVAEEAFARKTGARGLRTVLNEVLLLVNYYRTPKQFTINRAAVNNRMTAEELARRVANGESLMPAEHAAGSNSALATR